MGAQDEHVDDKVVFYIRREYEIFVIADGTGEGRVTFNAMRKDGARAASRMQATAILIPNGHDFAMDTPFYHCLPAALSRRLNVWIAAPRNTSTCTHLLHSRIHEGNDTLKSTGVTLLQHCKPITLDQCTAKWFTLRQFILTSSASTGLLIGKADVLAPLGFWHRAQHTARN